MPEIRYQQRDCAPEISLGEIHIPDAADLGTGAFTTTFKPGELPALKPLSSVMRSPPRFQISVTVNPNGSVPVLVGKADGTPAKDRAVFKLPSDTDRADAHTLVVQFAGWRITSALLDGIALVRDPTQGSAGVAFQ